MSQETIVAIVIAIIGSGGSGVFVTWILRPTSRSTA